MCQISFLNQSVSILISFGIMRILGNWIDNSPVPAASNDHINVINPANGAIIASVAQGNSDDANSAVDSAHRAYESWSQLTSKTRVSYLIRFHQLILEHLDELASLIVEEHGKTFSEAKAEILKGNETVEYSLSTPLLTLGRNCAVSRGVSCTDEKRSLGVVVSIVPFNFPVMVPLWTLPLAIATGNTLVLKPSEKVPLSMMFICKLLKSAGIPNGVVNIVNGGKDVVEALVDHPFVKAVTFVGTSRVAEMISHRARLLNKRCIALGGAKNHLVAVRDRDLEMTANDVLASFTGCAGQRCMAASVLLIVGDDDDLIDLIVAKAKKIVPGQSGGTEMGPVIDKTSKDKISNFIANAESGGARVLLDGRSWEDEKSSGFWTGPTVLLHTNQKDEALHLEIFGPVLSILVVPTNAEAIAFENRNIYGNAACIYTSSGATASWFTSRFQAGMIGINIGVPVPREPFSFGGIGQSKFGDVDITGDGAIEFFTERRKVTTKWGAPSEASWLS